MKNMRPLITIITSATLLAALAMVPGCDGDSTPINGGNGTVYSVQGAVVKDTNRNGTVSVVAAVSDDSTVTSTTLQFVADTLMFDDPDFEFFTGIDSVFSHTQTPVTSLAAGLYWLIITDPDGYRDSAMTAVSDTFSITSISPPNRILQGVGQVGVEWSTNTFVDGYVLAAVKQGKTYQKIGYAAVAASGVNSGTIPPEAFLDATGLAPDTGLFHIYVYAYFGAPDSAFVSSLLPTYFPFQAADNIDLSALKGRFGTVTVTAYDTVRVMLTK